MPKTAASITPGADCRASTAAPSGSHSTRSKLALHRIPLQFRRRAQRDNLSAKDQRQAVAVFRLLHVMGSYKDSNSLLGHLMNQFPELTPRNGIDAGGRLIEKDDGRLVQDGATQRQPLLPAARQRSGDQILLPFEIGHRERPFDPFLKLIGGHAVKSGKQAQVFDHFEIVVEREFLRHVADILAHGFRLAAHIEAGDLRARPDVGLSRPHNMRIVVDLPAPFGPRKPKTSPLRTSRLMRSTATKSPNRLTRFSTTTELARWLSHGHASSRADRIDKQIFNGRRDLSNRIEGNIGALEPALRTPECGAPHRPRLRALRRRSASRLEIPSARLQARCATRAAPAR